MNYFDESVMKFVNSFSRASDAFDYLMSLLVHNYLVKGGILMTIVWWFWFWDKKDVNDKEYVKDKKGRKTNQEKQETKEIKQNKLVRERIILTLGACLVAIFVGRLLVYVLPFRLRPLHEIGLNFITPYGINPNTLGSWSSFPSDHAVLFFALATGMFFISRIACLLVTIYILLIICFPRVYCGFHYPTDIIAGALLGIGIAWIIIKTNLGNYIKNPAMYCLNRWPGFFYACFFFLTYQIATMFDPVREIGTYIMCLFKPV